MTLLTHRWRKLYVFTSNGKSPYCAGRRILAQIKCWMRARCFAGRHVRSQTSGSYFKLVFRTGSWSFSQCGTDMPILSSSLFPDKNSWNWTGCGKRRRSYLVLITSSSKKYAFAHCRGGDINGNTSVVREESNFAYWVVFRSLCLPFRNLHGTPHETLPCTV